jgi:hypothetical protein
MGNVPVDELLLYPVVDPVDTWEELEPTEII